MSQVLDVDDANFETEVLRSERPVLVDFSATWCAPCKKLEPVVHEVASHYDGRLKVVRVDVDRSPATAARFAVLSVPTLVFFRDGQVKDQVVGALSKGALTSRLDRIV